MRVVKLIAENVKKIKAIEITPTNDIVTISGVNASGKTSVLDSLMYALAGASSLPSEPIRRGQKNALVTLDLGKFKVTRRFTAGGTSSVVVESAEGARFPSPQRMLDELLGTLTFDPLDFSRMDCKKQFDVLRGIAKVEVDLDQLMGLNRGDYVARTEINRQVRVKRTQAGEILVAVDLPAERLDESALVDEIQQAGDHNTKIEQTRTAVQRQRDLAQRRRDAAERNVNEIKKLDTQISELQANVVKWTQESEQIDVDATAMEQGIPAPIESAGIRVKLEHAKQVNSKIAQRETRARIEAEADALQVKAQELTDRMEARDKQKADAIAAAQMPIDGLGLGEGIVTFNGIPLDQASSAEQLKVSLAIAIAGNPKLRVIRIQDGSLLDDDSMAHIAAVAKEKDFQVWVERVDTSGKVGIVIEDGAVKAIDGELVPPKAEAEAAA